jgi:CubicO group peptidase (beta-lactamase class C family)
MDSTQLAAAIDFAQENRTNIHSLLVIRHGYVVADAYFYPFTRGMQHDVASVTKSVTATLVGIAIDKGYIPSVRKPVLSFFPERTIANMDSRKQAMTLEHLLTMTSGLACINEPSEVTLFQMIRSPNWVQFMLDLPMANEPGDRFVYNSGGVHLLSAIIRKATGMSALAFAHQYLFSPLGISDAGWPLDPQGLDNHGWGDLRLTPPDMAKIGYLYLRRGLWNGQQVVCSNWVAAATQKHVATLQPFYDGYGYLWWNRAGDGFSAVGRGYQRIFVATEQDLVVVVTAGAGGHGGQKLQELLTAFILPAIRSETSLPPDPAAAEQLATKVQQVGKPDEKPQPVSPLPPMAPWSWMVNPSIPPALWKKWPSARTLNTLPSKPKIQIKNRSTWMARNF